MPPITVGYATAHPRLKALDFQPSALLPSEAAAVYLKYKGAQNIATELCLSAPKNLCQSVFETFHLLDLCEIKTAYRLLLRNLVSVKVRSTDCGISWV